MNDLFLSGITPTGPLHIGNYIGSMKTMLELQASVDSEIFVLIADWHSLIKLKDGNLRKRYTYDLAAAWLALGLDVNRSVLYKQSDIVALQELNWILTTLTNKSLLERSHAYKAARDVGGSFLDMGLFSYPILMAADVLSIQSTHVVVGRDQIQHLEITRTLAARMSNTYHIPCVIPQAVLSDKNKLVRGTDGRKMSKSYDNTIPLFIERDGLHKAISGIITSSMPPNEPKDPEQCSIFQLYSYFANEMQIADMRSSYAAGISFKEAKERLFEVMDTFLTPIRSKYNYLLSNPDIVNKYLCEGAEKANIKTHTYLNIVRAAVGL